MKVNTWNPNKAIDVTNAKRTVDVAARQNHGMCVKGTAGEVEQIPNC